MRRQHRRSALAGLAALTLVATAGCSDDQDEAEPVEPAPVALSPDGAPDDLSVGVVVSLSSSDGRGSQWRDAAEGAQVATYRYDLGKTDVTLVPADDRGTAKGAEAAVEKLLDQGVSGIVVATEGRHVDRALEVATDAGVPVLMPYADRSGDLPEGVWATGPTREQAGGSLAAALEEAGLSRPLLVDAGGGQPPSVMAVTGERFRADADPARVAARVARAARGDEPVDSVVVSGPAQAQAEVVQALQGRGVDLPVYLTGDALSPEFGEALRDAGGSSNAALASAGLDNSDVVALEPGDAGAAMSAYLAGVRATAEDNDVRDFFDGERFAAVAAAADPRSHDAVVALVTAAAEAGSAEPAEVLEALGSLQVDAADGLAGPALDFEDPAAVDDEAVVALQSTDQDPGLRPARSEGGPRLHWFALPES